MVIFVMWILSRFLKTTGKGTWGYSRWRTFQSKGRKQEKMLLGNSKCPMQLIHNALCFSTVASQDCQPQSLPCSLGCFWLQVTQTGVHSRENVLASWKGPGVMWTSGTVRSGISLISLLAFCLCLPPYMTYVITSASHVLWRCEKKDAFHLERT